MSVAQIIMLIIGAFFFTALQAVAYSGMIIGIHLFLRAMGKMKAKDNQTLRLYRWLAVVVSVGAGAAQAGEIYFSDAYLSVNGYRGALAIVCVATGIACIPVLWKVLDRLKFHETRS